ncbi:type II toxin-antitoxin system RelE/ParE family toxin [Trinickia caryophylli]|uniref:ParE toxin of type II toxin-antitoxin system, parDE n=1 Tax=Trinickia caryophylli TaxID=28094 RepID=A0A1X7H9V1_TRICW|nr:type II toxin-antitoxin system RelE/ParE family toxin [Trinickia caryophylli]PMS08954.1 hypothetical protein C0Z17_27410 [Trinickia caryophylli]TRX17505.1 hypothetical protein FNF07_04160 [Trinickia caryophylli]WQE11748.1 type II toxin-antitoxin system RelE/ParE family toxin [Trinickia caryophylli]SMF82406.1 ParE toxin of type II toxin-antitoxin system, parDE [Trinickia caryophylli]GLU35817.1 hypothetical protein Busp01_56590 [Trinickia caryophylli]
MTARAVVEAAPNFLATLDEARRFLVEQDVDTAAAHYARLQAELVEMVQMLGWSPGCGRHARFLAACSAQARLRLARVQRLAAEAALPDLREFVLGQYVVLYAHSSERVALLAIKHQRQLTYSA